MNIHELSLNSFHTATVFDMYLIISVLLFAGFILGVSCWELFWADRKTYKQGQIDAANGIMNFEKKLNEDGKLTWVKKSHL